MSIIENNDDKGKPKPSTLGIEDAIAAGHPAEPFLATLDPSAKAFTFLSFDDNEERKKNGKAKPARQLNTSWQNCAEQLKRFNDQLCGVYVTVQEQT